MKTKNFRNNIGNNRFTKIENTFILFANMTWPLRIFLRKLGHDNSVYYNKYFLSEYIQKI